MHFSLNIAGDAFQQKLEEVFSGLQGVTGIADDMLTYGRTEEKHDRNCTAFLKWAQGHGLK